MATTGVIHLPTWGIIPLLKLGAEAAQVSSLSVFVQVDQVEKSDKLRGTPGVKPPRITCAYYSEAFAVKKLSWFEIVSGCRGNHA